MIRPSDFYVLGGTLPRDARSYAVRDADRELFDGLYGGQFCYVLTPRQMGKSSLMVRTVARLREEKVTCLVIDLTSVGQNLTEDQWYDGLLSRIATQLDLEEEFDAFWQENGRLGPLQRWMSALQLIVLARVPGPMVLFVDEIDAVRSLPFSADEFFAAIRECYNRRTEDSEFARLTFCLLGVATPADLIRDTRSTPFNIGQRIALTDFTEAEAVPLAEGLRECGGDAQATERLARVLYWTHGHPYLTQRLCQTVVEVGAKSASEVDRVCRQLFLSPGAQDTDDNLLFVRERLLRWEDDPIGLLLLYARVRSGKPVSNSETDPHITTLRLSGVVRVENGLLCVRNRTYAQVFDREWIGANLPGAEIRRQKMAFRKGSLSTALAIAGAFSVLLGGFMLTHYQRHLNLHVPLKDGTELIVHDVDYGKELNNQQGMFRWSALLGQHPGKLSFQQPRLCIWLSRDNPRTHTMDALEGTHLIAVDGHGQQFGLSQEARYERAPWDHHESTNPFSSTTRFDFTNFPRRGNTIRLQLIDGSGVVTEEFEVPNPTQTLYPLWTPESLPSTKQVGDLAVRLKAVRWAPWTWWTPRVPWIVPQLHPKDNYFVHPQWECYEAGQLTKAWEVESLEMSDATGNTTLTQLTGGNLSCDEPAWRLRMKLMRSQDAAIAAGETWTIKGVAIPKDGSMLLLKGIETRSGVTIKPISIATAPSVTYAENQDPKPSGTLGKKWGKQVAPTVSVTPLSGRTEVEVTGSEPQLAFRFSDLKENQRLTVWATDEKGKQYAVFGQEGKASSDPTPNSPDWHLFLPIPQTIHQVDLHFAVQEIRTVEFMVRPPFPAMDSKP